LCEGEREGGRKSVFVPMPWSGRRKGKKCHSKERKRTRKGGKKMDERECE